MILWFLANAELRHELHGMGVRTPTFFLALSLSLFLFPIKKILWGNFTSFIISKKKKKEHCNQWGLSLTHWIFIIRK